MIATEPVTEPVTGVDADADAVIDDDGFATILDDIPVAIAALVVVVDDASFSSLMRLVGGSTDVVIVLLLALALANVVAIVLVVAVAGGGGGGGTATATATAVLEDDSFG